MTRIMLPRLTVLALVLVSGGVYVRHATQPQPVPPLQPLSTLPLQMGEWQGRDAPAFSSAVLAVLGADDYLNRVYARHDSTPVGLYVGFYQSQRQGDAIHSPMNCMPGAGWEPVEHAVVALPVETAHRELRTIVVNEYVVEKGADRQVVLYWYQSHGRVVANEYASRIYMVFDAMRQNRTDAALVRVITRIVEGDADPRAAAAERTRAFVRVMFPGLSALLPS